MHRKTTDHEFDSATNEFVKTFNAFKKAAEKLMVIMENMTKKKDRELKDHSGDETGDDLNTYKFMIQTMDENSQTWQNCFGIKCVGNEEVGQD